MESEKLVTKTLLESMKLILDMYDDAIELIPETAWATGEIAYLLPVRLILHSVEAADYYTPDNPVGYLGEKVFGFDPDVLKIKPEDLPSKEKMSEYHQVVRTKFEDWVKLLSMDDLMKKEELFPWTSSTVLGRIIYVLEHYRQHMGELNAELRRRDLPRIKWRTFRSYG